MMLKYITQIILLSICLISINLFSMEQLSFIDFHEDILSNILFFTVNSKYIYLNNVNLGLKNIKQYFALKLLCRKFRSIVENENLAKAVFSLPSDISVSPINSSTVLRLFLKKYIEENGLEKLKQRFSLKVDKHKKIYSSIMHRLDDQYNNRKTSLIEQKLLIASAIDDFDTAKDLMQKGVSPDICNVLHFTPLMFAVMNNNKFVVNFLILCGASLDDKNFLGNSALKIAIDNGCSEIIKTLREAGAYEEELLSENSLRESGLFRRRSLSNRRSIKIPFKRANSFKDPSTIKKEKKNDSKKNVKKDKPNSKCISM